MLFNSIHFLIFLPVVFLLYWLLPHKWRWLLLLAASYYFYMSWNPWFGILLAATSCIDWFVGLQIEKSQLLTAYSLLPTGVPRQVTGDPKSGDLLKSNNSHKGKPWLLLSIFSNLGVLAAFKYSAFAYNTFAFLSSSVKGTQPHYFEALVIPVGLSFYVFHSMSYVIDVYRGKIPAEKHLGIFACFVAFFPQLVAGPVARFGDLGVQFRKEKKYSHPGMVEAVRLMTWGFFKKIVIADRLHDIVTPVFTNPHAYSGSTLFIVSFFFAVQIYCDFSGYSDIAKGTAKLFGFDLVTNFIRPLLSISIHGFWKRNHISVTSWFRDYLYIPLGGNRVSPSRHYLNIFLTFLISGFWHGANWTFVIWGALYGIIYLLEIPFMKFSLKGLRRFPAWIYLIVAHSLIMIAFRANTVHDLGFIYKKIFSGDWNFQASWAALSMQFETFPMLLCIVMIAFLFLKEVHEEFYFENSGSLYKLQVRPWIYVLLFTAIFAIGQFNANEFIYFHF
ncbi:MAG TPA: MBOAT family O-acyltransferase [Bacteroidia bacterium]|nr:MBOAT family O-acyltransferase [Bacteroidia bacterium]